MGPHGNDPILIRKVKEEHGWLGNMSPHPVVWEDKEYRTAEALFQSLRFKDENIIEDIRKQKSPMAAKFVAKKHKKKVVTNLEQDLENMRLCLTLKLEQHPDLKEKLVATGYEDIIEDCGNRRTTSGLFWGAALIDNMWIGANTLGKLWMQLRHPAQIEASEKWRKSLPRHKCHGTWKPYPAIWCSSHMYPEEVEEEEQWDEVDNKD